MGYAYNNLRTKNTELMEKLRLIAEKDALTTLGNRLAYNTYSAKLQRENCKVLMFLFDVNNLRAKNNEEGHSAGDKLLIDAAKCIMNVFGNSVQDNCFRIGGDEFVAFIKGEAEEKAQIYIDDFEKECEKHGIGVSVGYSYAEQISDVSAHDMFNLADQMMYKKKYGDKN